MERVSLVGILSGLTKLHTVKKKSSKDTSLWLTGLDSFVSGKQVYITDIARVQLQG